MVFINSSNFLLKKWKKYHILYVKLFHSGVHNTSIGNLECQILLDFSKKENNRMEPNFKLKRDSYNISNMTCSIFFFERFI